MSLTTAFELTGGDVTLVCPYLAEEGLLDAVIEARADGYPMDEKTLLAAATAGHLHVVQWCLNNGCHYTVSVFDAAMRNGNSNVCSWLLSSGYMGRSQYLYDIGVDYPSDDEGEDELDN
jgi:hypothetical protein